MSVLIKGMKMPKNCYECLVRNQGFSGDGMKCGKTGSVLSWRDGHRKRMDNCPLVPIPPHGRMIDADKQDAQIETLIERHLHGYTKSTWDFVCELRDILKRNSTIIPAELPVLHGTFAAASEQEALKRITTAKEGKT